MATNSLNGYSIGQIADMSLEALLPAMKRLSWFTTDFSDEVADDGTTVTTRYPGTYTASDLTTGLDTNASNSSTTAVTVTLGAVTGVALEFTDYQYSVASIDLERVFIKPMVNAIVKNYQTTAMNLITAANYGNAAFTGAASTFDADDVADLAGTLDGNDVMEGDRALFLSPTYYSALRKDNALLTNTLGSDENIRRGSVGEIFGFNVVNCNYIPGNSENLVGFACSPQAIAIASRVPAVPQNGYGEYQNVTDPDSGFTFQIRRFYDENKLKWRLAGLYMGGASKALSGTGGANDPDGALLRLVSS